MAKSKNPNIDDRLANVGDSVHGKAVIGVRCKDHGDGVMRDFEYLTDEETILDHRHQDAGKTDQLVAKPSDVKQL